MFLSVLHTVQGFSIEEEESVEIIQVRASHKMNHWESEMYLERQRGLGILN